MLGYAANAREARKILNNKELVVNGSVVTDPRFPIGLMDIVELKTTKEQFQVTFTKRGKITIIEAGKSKHRLCRVENKKILPGGVTQLNLWGGVNINVKKDEYRTGDVVKLGLADKKIAGKIELKIGAKAFIIGGAHVGETATVKELILKKKPQEVLLEKDEGEFRTRKENVYLIE